MLDKMNKEMKDNTKVTVIASLSDLGGKKYFLRVIDEPDTWIWLGEDLKEYSVVSKDEVFSAVIKHGYLLAKEEEFLFKERFEKLTNESNK